jgi:glycosyltransferase involved in cell wall biosynthesis
VSSPDIGKMDQSETSIPKLKVVRVVTASYVVPWHLANTLKRMPADFEVCVVGHDVSSCRDSYPDVKWVDIHLDRKINLVSDLLALFVLCRFFISYKPDIVHSIMPKAGLLTAIAGFICRVPVRIHTFTGQVWATKTGPARMFYYWLDRLINSLNTICLTDSPSQSAFLHAHKISSAGRALAVLLKGSLSGVDVARFNLPALTEQAGHLRMQLGLNETNFVFAFIARKTRDKGAIDVLRAFAAVSKDHQNARLLFVGPDESGGEIGDLSKSDPELFNNVIDVGQVENHELYLAISDVLCLPSHREGFGTIVIDAAAMGVPAIGSNIPGLVDSIEDGQTGLLFPVGDVEALAGIMVEFLENPGKYEKMRRSAKARVDEFFAADLLYDAMKTLYLELAGDRTRVEVSKHG